VMDARKTGSTSHGLRRPSSSPSSHLILSISQ
jgi:hypothetical protein